jgi:hypothetical protein
MAKDTKAETASDKGQAPEQDDFRKVDSLFADAWKPQGAGEFIVGIYVGSQEAIGKVGAFTAYHIKLGDGRKVSISGAALQSIMPQIPRKSKVRVTYKGKTDTDRGPMKIFDVEVAGGVQLIDPMDVDED